MSEQVKLQEAPVQGSPLPAPASAPMLLVNISSPTCNTPICRVGTRQELTGAISVQQLIERSTSLRSPMSLDVSVVQLESEMSSLLAIGGMLAAGTAEVLVRGREGQLEKVALDEPIHNVVRQETSANGNKFWIIDLEVHLAGEAPNVPFVERRQLEMPEVIEGGLVLPPAVPASDTSPSPTSAVPAPANGDAPSGPITLPEAPPSEPAPPPAVGTDPSKNIVVMVAGPAPQEAAAAETKGYVRKTDLLRAQFRPEVEDLDLSGLFVCEFGAVIREQRERRNVVLSDATRITEVLLQGNGFRRSGNYSKALTCYQELVDMDPSNADFRFLLGKTLALLGREDQAIEAFTRARELGHEGARKEIEAMRAAGVRSRRPLGFLRFWRQ